MASATTLAILMALAANAVFLDASLQEPSSADTLEYKLAPDSSIEESVQPEAHKSNSTRHSVHPQPSMRRLQDRLPTAPHHNINNHTLPRFYSNNTVHKNSLNSTSFSPLQPTSLMSTTMGPPTTTTRPRYPRPEPLPSPFNHYIPAPPQQPPFNCYCPGPVSYPMYYNYYPPQYPFFPTYPKSGQRPAPYNNMPSSGPFNQFPTRPSGFYDRLERPSLPEFNNQNTGAPKDPLNMFDEPSTTTEAPGYGFQLKTVSRNRTEEGSSSHYSSSSSW
ncbi:Protein of unknown function [Cotesia congregata]|uniref:Uncharacterized protein n=1 Tax=Cotesia congregata TaxID=51543 RepID=A0A8J2HBR1_COTCN|nr:Protein of unknown function [Cotesia congregata]